MKRLHVHITVPNLADSIHFYNSLFGVGPSREKSDYAKWQLDDPLVNFAISTRSPNIGLDHLGIQVENETDVVDTNNRLKLAAQDTGAVQTGTCCYAESTKSWSIDKAGIPWECFVTMKDAELFGTSDNVSAQKQACSSDKPSAAGSCC